MLVRTKYGIGETYSSDKGRTWEPGYPSSLVNADSRFHIRRLKSNRLLLIHHLPPNYKKAINIDRSYLTASLSEDDGHTWPYNLVLHEESEVSYPDVTEDKDENIYIVYDYDRYTKKEILYAKIREQDIINGTISQNSRTEQIISKTLN